MVHFRPSLPSLVLLVLAAALVPGPLWAKGDKKDNPFKEDPAEVTWKGNLALEYKSDATAEEFPFTSKSDLSLGADLPDGLAVDATVRLEGKDLKVRSSTASWKAGSLLKLTAGWGAADPLPSAWLPGDAGRVGPGRVEADLDDEGFASRDRFAAASGEVQFLGPWTYRAVAAFSGDQYTPRYQLTLGWNPAQGPLDLGIGGTAEPRLVDDDAGGRWERSDGYGAAWARLHWSWADLRLWGAAGLDRTDKVATPGDVPAEPQPFVGWEAEASGHWGPWKAGAVASQLAGDRPAADAGVFARWQAAQGWGAGVEVTRRWKAAEVTDRVVGEVKWTF